jgi:hypothetical protein
MSLSPFPWLVFCIATGSVWLWVLESVLVMERCLQAQSCPPSEWLKSPEDAGCYALPHLLTSSVPHCPLQPASSKGKPWSPACHQMPWFSTTKDHFSCSITLSSNSLYWAESQTADWMSSRHAWPLLGFLSGAGQCPIGQQGCDYCLSLSPHWTNHIDNCVHPAWKARPLDSVC